MNRPKIDNQITWVYTNDLDQTSYFYQTSLGLKLVLDEGPAKLFEVSPKSKIGVCKAFDNRVVEPAGSMITLVTNEVDLWYARLKDIGLVIKHPPHVLEKFNIYTFFVEDPNGYVIEFQQFLDSSSGFDVDTV